MINRIKSFYIIKEKILDFLPLKTMLKLFQKSSMKLLNSLQLNPDIYELYYYIRRDFEPYDDYLDNDMLSFIYHLFLLKHNLSILTIKEFYFRYLLEKNNISVYYDNIYFKDLLEFLQKHNYNKTLIIQVNDLKIDYGKYSDICISSSLINIEIFFNIKLEEKEKTSNILDIKHFLSQKIIAKNSVNFIKKINFLEPINLNDNISFELYGFLLTSFQKCKYNIQCNYNPEPSYWKNLHNFHQLKIVIGDKINENNEINEKRNYTYSPYSKLKLEQVNKNISYIQNLNDLHIDYSGKNICLTNNYFNSNDSQKPEKIILEDFQYDYRREYFGELNGVIELILIQKNFKITNYPIIISNKLQSLLVLQLEKINILEDHLVNIVESNPNLEIFEIKKKFSRYVYDIKLASALNNLKYLKILSTNLFWHKINLRSKELYKDFHIQENQFFKYLKSNSIKYLNISNESNINIHTIEINLPCLIRFSIEESNLISYDAQNENIDLINKKNKYFKNTYDNKQINNVESISFNTLRSLKLIKVLNFASFLKKLSQLNNLENLSLINLDKKVFESIIRYIKEMNNINYLTIIPDFGGKMTSKESESFIENIHNFKNLSFIDIGIYTMDIYLINLLYDELEKLKEIKNVKLTVELIFENEKQFLEEKMEELKNEKELLDLKIIYKEKRHEI